MLKLIIKSNILKIIGIITVILLSFLFFKILIYITISFVVFLIGYPLKQKLNIIRFFGKKLPNSISSFITLCLIFSVFLGVFFLIIPPLIKEITFLSELKFYDVLNNLLNQFPNLKQVFLKVGSEEDLKNSLSLKLTQLLNTSNIEDVFKNIFKYFGSFLGGALCTLFISFFLLKDIELIKENLLAIFPTKNEKSIREILKLSKKMLSNYFISLIIDMFIVGGTIMIFLTLFGIKNALLIAFCAGILNIIPYIGSIITMIIAVCLGVSNCISIGSYESIGPTIQTIFFTLLSINLIDALVLQPYLFSNSVKAHPLEIFIVTLLAGTLGGIFGMVVALPLYTIIRIIAKQFFTNFKFLKKISDSITD